MSGDPIIRHNLAAAMAAAARSINEPGPDLDHTLRTIVEVAQDALPGIDHVGISTVVERGRIVTRAQTDRLVTDLDDLQYELDEGPCVTSIREERIVAVPHIRHEQRWPRYVPRAVQLGLRSQLAVRLFQDDRGTVGGLNLYSTSQDEIHPEAVAMADLFATQAALALGHARERLSLAEAVASRKVIGQAIGIAMERYGINEEQAFAYLVRASSTSNRKLRAIAEELVQDGNARTAGQPHGPAGGSD